jgi:hypothetical protein
VILPANTQNPAEPLGTVEPIAINGKEGSSSPEPWLQKLAGLFGAQAAILWDTTDGAAPITTYSKNDSQPSIKMRQQDHDRLIIDVAASCKPILLQTVCQDSGRSDLLLVGKVEGETSGVVELIIEQDPSKQLDLALLEQRFRDAVLLISATSQSSVNFNDPTAPRDLAQQALFQPDQISNFLKVLHNSIDLSVAAANVANEVRCLLDYDRASVIVRQGRKQRIIAISGQTAVNRRSNTTRLLEKLADSVLRTGQPFWYPTNSQIPTAISQSLDQYIQVANARSLALVPLHDTETTTSEESSNHNQPRVIGGIVLETFQHVRSRKSSEPKVQFLIPHVENAIANAINHQQIFLYPLWRLLGRTRVALQTKYLTRAIGIVAAATILLLTMILWPVEFYVTAEGVLTPANRRPVFSSVKGEVSQVLVQHGDSVEKGQFLVRMASPDHDLRVEELQSQLKAANQRLVIIEDQRHSTSKDKSAEEMEENIVSLKSQIESLQAQLLILERISDSMNVRSPIDGQVITWDLKHQLENRVVPEGVRLLEVADIQGPWIVEIELPIRRQGHIARAIRDTGRTDLKVSFLPAADAAKHYSGRVMEIADVVSITSDHRQVIKVRAMIDDHDISIDQVRSAVSAKIYCGQSSLGYFIFSDIRDFVKKHLLFPLF